MDAAQRARDLAQQTVNKYTKSGEEPVSGETGQGTATKPFDAGNQDGMSSSHRGCHIWEFCWTRRLMLVVEQKGGPKDVAEPKSGVQGAGTKNEPFDQGNDGGEFLLLRTDVLKTCL